MAQPRYQIFVSSTFKDLQEERQAVLNAILKLNQFPAGMEIFPAVNDTAWEHIEKVIEDSDYYVLIIGGKYGSIEAESGISYTEKEYDFAVSKNIPVLAFTHADEDSIPVGKAERNEEVREKLNKFKQKVGNKHHWNKWKTLEELKENVITSLAMSFAINPQKGWVKAGGIDNTELLSRLADLQKRYDELTEENKRLKESEFLFDSDKFVFGDEIFELNYKYVDVEKTIQISWERLFIELGETLLTGPTDAHLHSKIGVIIYDTLYQTDQTIKKGNIVIPRETIKLIKIQLLALDLIEIIQTTINGTNFAAWQMTKKGQRFFLNAKAIQYK